MLSFTLPAIPYIPVAENGSCLVAIRRDGLKAVVHYWTEVGQKHKEVRVSYRKSDSRRCVLVNLILLARYQSRIEFLNV